MSSSDTGGPKGIAGDADGGLQACWLCSHSVAVRAPFCHSCGAVQPPRELDPFTRLGLERRFELDAEAVRRQHAGFSRAFDPGRFAARELREQEHARAQRAALDEAYGTLRDPVRRARCLLGLMGLAPDRPPVPEEEIVELRDRLAGAAELAALDRLVLALEQRIEACIKYLAIAFRNGHADSAARILARLDQLESLNGEVWERRNAWRRPPDAFP